ncbi:MAG: hypothetical protein N2255_10840 [Kiritimatiellae bacterium]|nr:hypothetical protein [Kiritimatiellia bacterium]
MKRDSFTGSLSVVQPWFVAAWLAGMLICMNGCRSAQTLGSSRRIHVALAPDGTVVVRGRHVPVKSLPSELRRLGAGPKTEIMISIPRDTPRETEVEIIRTLRAEGFNRAILTKPRQVTAYTTPKTPEPSSRRGQDR